MSCRAYRSCRLFCLVLFSSLLLVMAGVGCGSSPGVTPPNKALVSISAAPTTASIRVGATQQFTATGTYSDGSTADVTSSATWTSSSTSVATVSTGGLATAVAAGSATVTAAVGTVTGTAALTVTGKTVSSIAVTPATASVAAGSTEQFAATATYSDGSTGNVTSTATWTSSSSAVATVNAAGLATGVAAGTATVTATLSGVSGTANLTVTAVAATLTSITVTPTTASIAAGAAQQFTATATYSNGTTANVTSTATWTSSSTATATVSAGGLATGVAAGSTTITATVSGVSGTASLTVAAKTVTKVAVTPATASIAAGATQQFTATATYSDGSTATVTATATWSSSSAATATISAGGLATGVAAGSATITATAGGVSGTASLTVSAKTVTKVAVTPATASITAGATEQFTATATYSDGSTGNVTAAATWSSSSTATATISTAGVATGVAAGSTTITATVSGTSGTAALTVTAKTVSSIAVTPPTPSVATGSTQQFTATATYSDGTTANVTTTATWASSNTSIITVNASGLATAVASGSATITASVSNGGSSGTISGSASVTVTVETPKSIAVTPASPSIGVGATQQFTATATYSTGSTANVTSSATWSSSSTATATISSGGLATGVAAGSTTITATVSGVSGTAALTVTTATTMGTVNITTWHVDTNRSGLNSNETALTPTSVSGGSFGKLFSYSVDGYVYGSPLVMSSVSINGSKHDVVFAATEKDSVYAFDADSYGTGAPLWQVSLLQSGETPLTDGPIQPYEGVTSTPVIDPKTGTLYVVSTQKNASGTGFFRLHALDITTGAEKFGGPVTLNVSVAATNSASVGGVQTLNTSCIQRAALLLANGNVYMGFGGCHSGWLVAYNASNLTQVGVFNSSTVLNGEGQYASAGGVWMGGGGPVADSDGNVYVTTGNGPWNGTNAFADSVLKFGPKPVAGANGSMQPIDYFTPSIYQYMDCQDSDLAAGGLILIPGTTTLIAGGKTGTMFLVDSSNLGKESSNDSGAIQEQVWGAGLPAGNTYASSCTDSSGVNNANITSYEIFGTSAYYNNYVYLGVTPTSGTAPGGVRQFTYSGTLTPDAMSDPTIQQGTRGTSPFISSNGSQDGIVWMIDQGNPLQNTSGAAPSNATLYAYNADQYPTELWDSSKNSADTPGYGIKFSSPVVANGKVYISTGHDLTTVTNPSGEIDVYGLK